jgi:hypothetical protein
MRLLVWRCGRLSLSVVVVTLVAAWVCSGASAKLLWANMNGVIAMANEDSGHGVIDLFSSRYPMGGIAVDGNEVYWTPLGNEVARAEISGSHLIHVTYGFLTGPSGTASVAVSGDFIYWANSRGIERAELNGSHVDPNFVVDPGADAATLTISGDHLYWSDDCSAIVRVQLNGAHAPSHIDPIAQITPYVGGNSDGDTCDANEVAVSGSYVYWAGDGLIGRLTLNGSHASHIDLRFIDTASRVSNPEGGEGPDTVVIDGDHIYWNNDSAIGRAQINGGHSATHIEQNFIHGSGVYNLALGLSPGDVSPPTISGTAKQPHVLKEAHGTWLGNPAGYSYQWESCNSAGHGCNAITSATGRTLSIGSELAGRRLRVIETAHNLWGKSSSTSAATAAVRPLAPANLTAPQIDVQVGVSHIEPGDKLQEVHGTWSNHPLTRYVYQWADCYGGSCTPIAGATGQSYTLTSNDVGNTIIVEESAVNLGGTSAPVSSSATETVWPNPPVNSSAPSMAGDLSAGQVLTDVHGVWSGSPTSYDYQWEDCHTAGTDCNPIVGATNQTYALTNNDVGYAIVVTESGVNVAGTGAPVKSMASGAVGSGSGTHLAPVAPTISLPPVIAGVDAVDQPFSASTGAWEGTPVLSYAFQWQVCASASTCQDITGATSATFTTTTAQGGMDIRVAVTASNDVVPSSVAYSAEAAISAAPVVPCQSCHPSAAFTTHMGQDTWLGAPTVQSATLPAIADGLGYRELR